MCYKLRLKTLAVNSTVRYSGVEESCLGVNANKRVHLKGIWVDHWAAEWPSTGHYQVLTAIIECQLPVVLL